MITPQQQTDLLNQIAKGLPICERPYQALAEQFDLSEEQVIEFLNDALNKGTTKRFGMVVNHHRVGYQSNAMVVWNVPSDVVDKAGEKFAKEKRVTLCYKRPRRLPHWPYNLFTMIHGKSRDEVLGCLNAIIETHNIDYPHNVLFSTRKFKQTGARYEK